jgi:anti-sigma regulatory factor (Ser/Thr protein kinase)
VSPDSHVRLTLPADASFLTVCRAALSGILADAGDDEVEESKLVLSEVCAAAIAHGNGVTKEIMDRLTTRWSVDRDAAAGSASVRFARRLR